MKTKLFFLKGGTKKKKKSEFSPATSTFGFRECVLLVKESLQSTGEHNTKLPDLHQMLRPDLPACPGPGKRTRDTKP